MSALMMQCPKCGTAFPPSQIDQDTLCDQICMSGQCPKCGWDGDECYIFDCHEAAPTNTT